jgi:hypothetical protein
MLGSDEQQDARRVQFAPKPPSSKPPKPPSSKPPKHAPPHVWNTHISTVPKQLWHVPLSFPAHDCSQFRSPLLQAQAQEKNGAQSEAMH